MKTKISTKLKAWTKDSLNVMINFELEQLPDYDYFHKSLTSKVTDTDLNKFKLDFPQKSSFVFNFRKSIFKGKSTSQSHST